MKTSKTIFRIASIVAITISLTSCSLFRKSVEKPAEQVKKVAYADKILLHMHPEKVLNYLPNLKDEQIAYLFGMSVTEYRAVRKKYDEQAKNAAIELLEDTTFANKVKELPFKKDETILVLGESTTDALNSWVVILKHLLEIQRPQDNIAIINAAVAGQTTTEALKRITMQVKQKPDWVLCFLGSNDCGRYGDENNKTNVSLTETLGNLNTIRKIVADEIPNTNFVWLTPLPINEEKAASFIWFKKMKLGIRNSDLLAIGDSLKQKNETVIDFRKDFGVPAKSEFLQFDGVHLTIEGQALIVNRLVNSLTQ